MVESGEWRVMNGGEWGSGEWRVKNSGEWGMGNGE